MPAILACEGLKNDLTISSPSRIPDYDLHRRPDRFHWRNDRDTDSGRYDRRRVVRCRDARFVQCPDLGSVEYTSYGMAWLGLLGAGAVGPGSMSAYGSLLTAWGPPPAFSLWLRQLGRGRNGWISGRRRSAMDHRSRSPRRVLPHGAPYPTIHRTNSVSDRNGIGYRGFRSALLDAAEPPKGH